MTRLTLASVNSRFNQYSVNVFKSASGYYAESSEGLRLATSRTLAAVKDHTWLVLTESIPRRNQGTNCPIRVVTELLTDVDNSKTFTSATGDYCLMSSNFPTISQLDQAEFDAFVEGYEYCPLYSPDNFHPTQQYPSCDIVITEVSGIDAEFTEAPSADLENANVFYPVSITSDYILYTLADDKYPELPSSFLTDPGYQLLCYPSLEFAEEAQDILGYPANAILPACAYWAPEDTSEVTHLTETPLDQFMQSLTTTEPFLVRSINSLPTLAAHSIVLGDDLVTLGLQLGHYLGSVGYSLGLLLTYLYTDIVALLSQWLEYYNEPEAVLVAPLTSYGVTVRDWTEIREDVITDTLLPLANFWMAAKLRLAYRLER